MSKVVAIHGHTIKGAPNPDVIEELERLLEDARRGDLEAIAYCTVYPDSKGTGWAGGSGTRDAVAAAIMMLQHRYAAAILEPEE